MMRKTVVIAVSILLVIATSVAAADFLHGEVRSVDREQKRMLVLVSPGEEGGHLVSIVLTVDVLMQAQNGRERLPGCIQPGKHVRIWGEMVKNDSGRQIFQATEVRGCGMRGCNDPTGVRERLYLGRHKENSAAAPLQPAEK